MKLLRLLALSVAMLIGALSSIPSVSGENPRITGDRLAVALLRNDQESISLVSQATVLDLMAIFKRRQEHGIGIGVAPGRANPDGIESMIMALSKKVSSKTHLDDLSDDLILSTQITAAVAKVLPLLFTIKNVKNKELWLRFSKDMRITAIELGSAINDKDPHKVKRAAARLNNTCNNCHSAFRGPIEVERPPGVKERVNTLLAGNKQPLSVLAGLLNDKDMEIRCEAISHLSELSADEKVLVPMLARASKDPDIEVCEKAIIALGRLGQRGADATPSLVEALSNENMTIRARAAIGLSHLGPVAVPALLAVVKDKQGEARRLAIYALGRIGSDAKDAWSTILQTFNTTKDDLLHLTASEALKQIDPKKAVVAGIK